VGGVCDQSALPGGYGPSSITEGCSTTSPMRIMAQFDDRLGDPLHTNWGKIEISQAFRDK